MQEHRSDKSRGFLDAGLVLSGVHEMAVGMTGPTIWDRAMQLTNATNSASKPAPERQEGEPRDGRPIAIGDPDETLSVRCSLSSPCGLDLTDVSV